MDIHEVVALAHRVKDDLGRLRSRSTLVVMFVDLVGSTEFKVRHPGEEEWLPRLAKFLLGVTRIVESSGRVVKYIGDEVMATFEGPGAVMAAEQAADSILDFCEQMKDEQLGVKIALDYGEVSLLDFTPETVNTSSQRPGLHAKDPQGLVVDRCARIMRKAKLGAVLSSAAFREGTRWPDRWKRVGAFHPRGLAENVEVFLLQTRGAPELVVEDEDLSIEQCKAELEKVRTQLEEARRLNTR